MKYQPREERDIRSALVVPAGEYDFEVVDAEEKVSKKGNDMIEMQLKVFIDVEEVRVKDWLVPGTDLGDLKLNQFAHATGLQDIYFNSGLTAYSCVGACGRLRLGITSSAEYGTQNAVKSYVSQRAGADQTDTPYSEEVKPKLPQHANVGPGRPDDIPF